MIDPCDGSVYKFLALVDPNKKRKKLEQPKDDEEFESLINQTQKEKPLIVRLPRDRGITGISIVQKSVEVVHNGDHNLRYEAEIDNSVGLAVIKNCIIGPCYDTKG